MLRSDLAFASLLKHGYGASAIASARLEMKETGSSTESMTMRDEKAETATPLLALWIALVAALAVGGSLAFACAAPLAAIAALAALTMRRVAGVVLVVTAWLANQIVGFGILHYPPDVSTFGWGGAIGAAAVFGFLAAQWAVQLKVPSVFRLGLTLVVAYAVYEVALFAYGVMVGGSDAAFTPEIVARIFVINAIAFAGLLVLHRGAVALSLLRQPAKASTAAA